MIAKNIKYVDFNGIERDEIVYFNLTKAEILELESETDGGLTAKISKMYDENDDATIFKMFKNIIARSYGKKSNDGRRFIKTDDSGNPLYREFLETEAYSTLFMELSTNADAATEFITGILPADLAKKQSEFPTTAV